MGIKGSSLKQGQSTADGELTGMGHPLPCELNTPNIAHMTNTPAIKKGKLFMAILV